MVIVKANEESELGTLPSQDMLEKMGKFNEELVEAHVMLAGEGLRPTREARRVRYSDSGPSVIEGPFLLTGDSVAGFWLWQVKDLDEAVKWAKKAPFEPGDVIEIRPLYETQDFAPVDPSGKLRESEERLREVLAERQKK